MHSVLSQGIVATKQETGVWWHPCVSVVIGNIAEAAVPQTDEAQLAPARKPALPFIIGGKMSL